MPSLFPRKPLASILAFCFLSVGCGRSPQQSGSKKAALPAASDAVKSAQDQKTSALFHLESPSESEFKVLRSQTVEGFRFVEFSYVSQTWKNTRWEHSIVLFWPEKLEDLSKVALLTVEDDKDYFQFLQDQLKRGFQGKLLGGMAANLKLPVAILNRVPPVPQLNIDKTDKLIEYTLARFLETGEADWPVLVPMTRSILGAMDHLEDYLLKEHAQQSARFLLIGGSKTAWASWLASVHDGKARVAGLISAAFNVLHFEKNLAYQHELWGKLSDQLSMVEPIAAALSQNEKPQLKQRAGELIQLLDPYYHLEELTFPKLLISGANDPYFPSDSERFYWSSLKGGENHRLYLPNFGHHGSGGLSDLSAILKLVTSIQGFLDLCFRTDVSTPRFQSGIQGRTFTVRTAAPAASIAFWKTDSPSRDLRRGSWTPLPAPAWDPATKSYRVELAKDDSKPVTGAFAEIHWELKDKSSSRANKSFLETTEIFILDKKE